MKKTNLDNALTIVPMTSVADVTASSTTEPPRGDGHGSDSV